jgi:very-short-patch-repair endonuclease
MAAVLACGPRALVSHGSAAWLWEAGERPGGSSPVDVTVPRDVRVRRAGIRVHRATTLAAEDATTVDGIPITTPARTLVDLAAVLSARELERAVARAERRRLVTGDQLSALVAAHRGRPGIATLSRVIAQEGGVAFTRSRLESLFADAVRRFGLPVPAFNQRVAGHELDCYWPDARMAVELDGAAYHASWKSHENDRRRDADLSAAGIHVVRVTWRQLIHDTERTMVRIAQALAICRERMGWRSRE